MKTVCPISMGTT